MLEGMERNDAIVTNIFRFIFGALVGVVLVGAHIYFIITSETMGHDKASPRVLQLIHSITALTCFSLTIYVCFLPRPWLLKVNVLGSGIHMVVWTYLTYLVEGYENLRLFQIFVALWLPLIGLFSMHVVKSVLGVKAHLAELRGLINGSEHMKTL